MAQLHQRKKSSRLTTTTPGSVVGAALESVRSQISPKLFEGLEIQKVSTSGNIAPRILTLSDDLFTIFVSHHRVGKQESLKDRFHYKGFKAYATVVEAITGTTVQKKSGLRAIDVADILFVQTGFVGSRKLEACNEKAKSPPDDLLHPASIISIFHNNVQTTDILVDDESDREAVLSAIRAIRGVYAASIASVGREERLLRYAWYDIDWNKNGVVDREEFLILLARLNIYLKKERAIQIFEAYVTAKHTHTTTAAATHNNNGRIGGGGGGGLKISKHNHRGITFDECLYVLRRIKLDQNDGIKMSDVVWDEVFGKRNDVVSAEEFLEKFVRGRQKDGTATLDDVKLILSELNGMELSGAVARTTDSDGSGGDAESIDRVRFGEYLTGSRNDLFDPEREAFDPLALSDPISHYWINSSHNTYSTGDQLKSLSSVEMYAVAMQRGCKCLELDCWDESDGYPIVYHGYTLTSKIPFRDILLCVRGYVDDNPKTLPIILSLENHCSHPFQVMMADMLEETLGDRLYVPDDVKEGSNNDDDHGSLLSLPSPLDLVGRVVIKGKRPPEREDDDLTVAASESIEYESSFEEEGLGGSKKKDDGAPPPPPPKIVPELVRLTLFNGVKYKDLGTSVALPISHMHSFSESKVLKVLNGDDPASTVPLWRKYNRDHMTRTYPAGSRVDSSNYNPLLAWHLGSQLVALNFQTDDSPMIINDGRFRENGGCGYIRKPSSVMSVDEDDTGKKMSLRIKILCGSCLPKPYGESVGEVIDPYVVVRVHDVDVESSVDSKRSSFSGQASNWLVTTERQTSSVRDNGFYPQWTDAEEFDFSVAHAEVAMLEFIVMDRDQGFVDDCMCKSAIPVSCLRQGLRSVQFYNQGSQHGPFGCARLLVDVDIKYLV